MCEALARFLCSAAGPTITHARGEEVPATANGFTPLRSASSHPPLHPPRAPGPAVKVAGPSAAPLAARRSQAALWAAALTGVTALFAYAALRLVPRPPGAGGAPPPPHGPAGVGADAACGILGMAAAMCVGLQLLQELLLRPLILHSGACKAISEAVFYASSLLVRCAFAAALAYYHFGPDWSHSASGAPHARGRAGYITAGVAAGGGGHTLTTALFVAAYVSDILQLTTRQDEFARGFVHTSVLHRYLSLGWAALWLMLLAPQGPGGAPIFNAVSRRPAASRTCARPRIRKHRSCRAARAPRAPRAAPSQRRAHHTLPRCAGDHVPDELPAPGRLQAGVLLPRPQVGAAARAAGADVPLGAAAGEPGLPLLAVPRVAAGLLGPRHDNHAAG